jgi:hypothetical protein
MRNENFDDTITARRAELSPMRKRVDQSCLADLIAVLEANPRGLRRWSVMRAMRARAEKANREISPKFEDDVERVFRRFCEGDAVRAGMTDTSEELFFRPQETAGEVWAVHAERARALLESPGAF